jgi:hypothetical protein
VMEDDGVSSHKASHMSGFVIFSWLMDDLCYK